MSDPIHQVAPPELQIRLKSGERLVILDVREPIERAIASIKIPAPSVDLAIPMGEIPEHLGELTAIAAEAPVVVVCHHGQRSMTVAQWLASKGVVGLGNLDGGIAAWSSQVDRSVPTY